MNTATITAHVPEDWRCPLCNCAEATREDPEPRDEETGRPKFLGGWNCLNCGYIVEDDEQPPLDWDDR